MIAAKTRERVRRRRLAFLLIGTLISGITAMPIVTPARAAVAKGASSALYSQPRWWAKYQRIAHGGTAMGSGTTTSVTVGPNVDASNEPGPQSETSISIDPSSDSIVLAGSNEIDRSPMRSYRSTDGGRSYTGVDLPLPPPLVNNGTDFGSDPGVAWDTRGHAYYSYIVVFFSHGGGTSINGTEMAVARSSNDGRTWTSTYFAPQTGQAQFNDKPYIAVDTNPGSPHRDTIYVAWDNATGGNGKSASTNGILVSRSTDGGRTFSTPVYASPTNNGPASVIAADPFVAPDGTLHVAWHDVQNNRVVESASTDGGQTFGPIHTIAQTVAPFDVGIPAMASRRALVYPACDADRSGGPTRGTLYCSWADETVSNGMDVLVSRSTDGGATWSAPVRANDDPAGLANDQFNQWLSVDPSDGSVNLSWNDTRSDPAHLSTDVYYARSTDGGRTFSPNVKVTTAPTNETCCGADLGNQYGDYEGISAANGVARPVWTDRRTNLASLDEEVFTAAVTAR